MNPVKYILDLKLFSNNRLSKVSLNTSISLISFTQYYPSGNHKYSNITYFT